MADIYDVLELVARQRQPSHEQLLEHCTQLLSEPMPDHVFLAIQAEMQRRSVERSRQRARRR